MNTKSVRTFTSLPAVLAALLLALAPAAAQTPATLQSETPRKFEPTYHGFDHVRRDVMIPMRDGVRLRGARTF